MEQSRVSISPRRPHEPPAQMNQAFTVVPPTSLWGTPMPPLCRLAQYWARVTKSTAQSALK